MGKAGKKFGWLTDRHDFAGSTWLHVHGWFDGIACEREADDEGGGDTLFVIDCNVWPPAEEDMSELRPDVDGADLMLVGVEEGRRYWRRRIELADYGERDVFQYEVSVGPEVEPVGPPLTGNFYAIDCVVAAGVIYGLHQLEAGRRSVTRLSGGEVTTLLEPEGEVVLTTLGPGRLLISTRNLHLTDPHDARYWIWDERAGLSAPRHYPLVPVQVDSALAWLGGDEILFCSKTSEPHANNMAGHEYTLHLHRFDVATGALRSAALEGFGSTLKFDARMLVTQPKQPVVLRSFEGTIDIARGADGWWILNYRTQHAGKRTICWLWHEPTDTVVPIASADMPGHDVLAVLYSPGLAGYLVSVPHAIFRLARLDDIVAYRGGTSLCWT